MLIHCCKRDQTGEMFSNKCRLHCARALLVILWLGASSAFIIGVIGQRSFPSITDKMGKMMMIESACVMLFILCTLAGLPNEGDPGYPR